MSQLTRNEALALMIAALAGDASRQFQVGIVGYFLDGIPHSADGLAILSDQTLNLVVGQN